MKKRLLIAALALTTSSFAASGSGPFIKGGFAPTKGKVVSETMPDSVIDMAQDDDWGTNWPVFTVGYERAINRVLSVDAGVGLSFYGHFVETWGRDSVGSYESTKDRRTYLSIPVNAKVQIPVKNGGFHLSAGPYVDFLLSAKGYYSDKEGGEYSESDIKDAYNSVNVGAGFRIGGEIGLGKHNLILESGYDYGFSDIFKEDQSYSDMFLDDSYMHNKKNWRLVLLSAGFRFNTSRAK